MAAIAWCSQPSALDTSKFEATVRQARAESRQGDHTGGRQSLIDALALWRGPALADVEGADFAAALTVHWDDLRLEARADLLELDVRSADAVGVIGELQDLASGHPLRERFSALLITALASADRVPEAYERLRQYLPEALGSDPSPTLQQLHLSLLRGEITPATA